MVDAHERYPYTFSAQQVRTSRRALDAGDYAICVDGRVVAAVERKALSDLVSSATSGTLRFALTALAALPRAAVIVEERYSQIFAQPQVRPSVVADAVAELQVRWPSVPIVFADNRKLAEEWTYRYLAAAGRDLHQRRRVRHPATQRDPTEPLPTDRVGHFPAQRLKAQPVAVLQEHQPQFCRNPSGRPSQ